LISVAVLLLFLVAPMQIGGASEPQSGAASAACEKFYMPGTGLVCEVQPGHYEMFAPDGRSLGFTHGPDKIEDKTWPGIESAIASAIKVEEPPVGVPVSAALPAPTVPPATATTCPLYVSVGGVTLSTTSCLPPTYTTCPFTYAGPGLTITTSTCIPTPTTTAPAALRNVHCVDENSPDYHVKVVRGRAFDDIDAPGSLTYDGDAYQMSEDAVRTMALTANTRIDTDGMRNGIHADYKAACEQGQLKIYSVVLWTPLALTDFSSIVMDMQSRLGMDNPRAKYWIYWDAPNPPCGCSGQGMFRLDDTAAVTNLNNGNSGPMYAATYGTGATGWTTFLHEAGHTMGAVQESAPHSNGPGTAHCWENNDIMCYPENPYSFSMWGTAFNCPGAAQFDCREDDYFSTRPAAGSYLTGKWNIAASYNRFIVTDASTVDQKVQCMDDAVVGQPVACIFVGGSVDASGVRYEVDWGDGSPVTRDPATGGFHPATKTRGIAQHSYASPGTYTIHVKAFDLGAGPGASGGVPWTIRIHPTPDTPAGSCAATLPSLAGCPVGVGRI
jgi:hypothetical protein